MGVCCGVANKEEDPDESERDRALSGMGSELDDRDMSVAGLCALESLETSSKPIDADVMGVLSTGGPSFLTEEMGTQSMPAGVSISSGPEMAGDPSDDVDFLENSK